MWLALTRLETQIQGTLPDLAMQVEEAKDAVFALLPQSSQNDVGQIVRQQSEPIRSFNEQVAAAEKNPNVDRRDQQLVFAVMGASANEDLDTVLRVFEKISDSALRPPLLNWIYFSRTQSAIKNKQLQEARKFASKVVDLDRAIAVLGDAVKNINRIEQPDFSRQFVLRKIEGKTLSVVIGHLRHMRIPDGK